MIKSDYHVHSDFSSDSTTPMEQMIEQALELGLEKICFTDHMDYDYPQVSDFKFVFDMEDYIESLNQLKERYYKRIEICTGIELGLQPHLTDKLNALTDSYPFDFIIGSSHVVDHLDPYYPKYWEDKTKEEGIRRYFESMIENCKAFQGFHVYGHLDYIIRYVPNKFLDKKTEGQMADYCYLDYVEILDEVLRTLINHGKGIEINTAGIKYGLGYPHPKADIVKRYKELGGEIITIGSDAHKPEHLCYDFHLIPDYLRSIGFQYYTLYKKGKPVFEKL